MSNEQQQVHERASSQRPHVRLGHALAGQSNLKRHSKMQKKRAVIKKRDDTAGGKCLDGSLYTQPTAGATIDANKPLDIVWKPSCIAASKEIDIYLYSNNNNLPIQAWRGVPLSQGKYSPKLYRNWWGDNSTHPISTSVDLRLNIVPNGNEPWDSANPIGPSFSATYDANTPVAKSSSVISFFYKGGITPGGKAAAIICPLIVVIVALAVWIRKLHINRNNKTADWADHMDKRMSRISLDWQAGGDGSAGPVPGSRPASFYQHQQPHVGNNMAGFGAAPVGLGRGTDGWNDFNDGYGDQQMMENRPRGLSMYEDGNRTSRISFAQSTTGDRVSRISFGPSSMDHSKNSMSLPRLGQNGTRKSTITTDSYYDPDAPAVPKLDDAYIQDNRLSTMSLSQAYADADALPEDDELIMSPTQHDGPAQLGHAEVDRMRDSLSAGAGEDDTDQAFRQSVLQYPALSFMQDGAGEQNADPFSQEVGDVSAPHAEHANAHSYMDTHEAPFSMTAGAHALSPEHPMHLASQTGMAPPVNAASPDDAMKQYAALRSAAVSPPQHGGSNVMRTLYTPDLGSNHGPQGHRPNQNSVAGSSLNEDDVVGYNEMLS